MLATSYCMRSSTARCFVPNVFSRRCGTHGHVCPFSNIVEPKKFEFIFTRRMLLEDRLLKVHNPRQPIDRHLSARKRLYGDEPEFVLRYWFTSSNVCRPHGATYASHDFRTQRFGNMCGERLAQALNSQAQTSQKDIQQHRVFDEAVYDHL